MDKTERAKALLRYAEEIVMTTDEVLADFSGFKTTRLVRDKERYYLIEMVNGTCTRIVELEER